LKAQENLAAIPPSTTQAVAVVKEAENPVKEPVVDKPKESPAPNHPSVCFLNSLF
jgi:hypothetical protein